MNKHALALAALSLLSTGVAVAQEAKSDFTITGNAGLYSDYRFRGYSQTGKQPAFQGGFDIAHSSGLYVGNWNSNVESGLYRGASLEMDFYGGYKYAVGPVGVDVGVLHYAYPSGGDKGGLKAVKQTELYVGASYSIFTAKFSYGLTNFFGLGDGAPVSTDGNYYLDLGAAYDLGNGWGANAHVGYQYIKNGEEAGLKADNATDYKIGVTKDLSGWIVGGALIGTSKKDLFTTANGRDAGNTTVVLSVARSF